MTTPFIELYFGQPARSLTYQDVENYFTVNREESDTLELKSYHTEGDRSGDAEKENGIIRSIAAFLNSGGGLIIWGAPAGQTVTGRSEKVFTGNLSATTRLIEKDRFISRVTDNIIPAPNKVQFHTYEHNGNYVYLIEVTQSDYSPHQFSNRYYMRIDGQTKPAPHHYIEALFKKISFPKLEGYITASRLRQVGPFFYLDITARIFNLSRLQNELRPFYRLVAGPGAILLDSLTTQSQKKYFMGGHELRSSDNLIPIFYNQPLVFTETLRINPTEVQANNSELAIWFWFAGEKSPLLVSQYQLRFDFQRPLLTDLGQLFTEINENRYSYEISDETELSDRERIDNILGRTQAEDNG